MEICYVEYQSGLWPQLLPEAPIECSEKQSTGIKNGKLQHARVFPICKDNQTLKLFIQYPEYAVQISSIAYTSLIMWSWTNLLLSHSKMKHRFILSCTTYTGLKEIY